MDAIVEMCLDRWFTPDFQSSVAAKRVGEIIARNTPVGYRGGVDALCGFDVTARLHEIAAPTLVMPGALDKGTPPRCSDVIADAIPDARLEVIDDARHIAIVERPDACNTHLIQHMKRFA